MSKYEFSLLQEVLLEKGAGVLGDIFRYRKEKQIIDQNDPVIVMYSLVWKAKQDILLAENENDLAQIEGKLSMADDFLVGIRA